MGDSQDAKTTFRSPPRKSFAPPKRPAPTAPTGPPPGPVANSSPLPAPVQDDAPPPPPSSAVDPSLLRTLSALQRFSESDVPAGQDHQKPKPKAASLAEVPAPLHWLMQLSKQDLQGAGVYSKRTLETTKFLLKLFSYLEADDLFRSAEVCKLWNVLSEIDSVWEPLKVIEPKRIEKALDGQRRRYLRMERINVRVHIPANTRRPKDFVIGVRKHSKLWSDGPMEMRGFWAQKAKENSKTAEILKSQDSKVQAESLHTVGDIKCIIIDVGTYQIKAGFSAELRPSLHMPSYLAYFEAEGKDDPAWKGLPTLNTDEAGNILLRPLGTFGVLVGPEVHDLALSSLPKEDKQKFKKYKLKQLSTQEDSKETWADWSHVFGYIFANLHDPASGRKDKGVDPTQHPVLVTQPIFAPRYFREKITEILFEQFNVPAVHLSWTPIASAYGYDTVTCLALDLGESSAQLVPIYEGTIIEPAMKRVAHLSGNALNQFLIDKLPVRATKYFPGEPPCVKHADADFRQYQLLTVIRNIKDLNARIAPSAGAKDQLITEKEYIPTVGAVRPPVVVNSVLAECGELLFDTKRVLEDQDASIISLPELIHQVVENCPLDVRAALLSNIILSGGQSQFSGLTERLNTELKAIYKNTSVLAKSVQIKALPDRADRVWIGGAELARLGMGAQHVWLSRDLYDESGAWALEKSH